MQSQTHESALNNRVCYTRSLHGTTAQASTWHHTNDAVSIQNAVDTVYMVHDARMTCSRAVCARSRASEAF